MKHVRSTILFVLAIGLLIPASQSYASSEPSPVGSITALYNPLTRQVIQRRDDNVGTILIVGSYSGAIDSFQASSTLQPGMNGSPQGWTNLTGVVAEEGRFIGYFKQPAGGFYNIQVRPVYKNEPGAAMTISTIGVGEVFLTAGQSNATSNGIPTGFLPSTLVSCFNEGPAYGIDTSYPGASWRWAIDPQPAVDNSSMGSVWPTMATDLANATGVPIGMYAAGCGGTSLAQWLPGQFHFTRLVNAMAYFTGQGGFRAILWDQGETDYYGGTSEFNYKSGLQILINESRAVTGVQAKWMIAKASTPLSDNMPERNAIEQAQSALLDYTLIFPGPDTDSIGLPYRIYIGGDPIHFNAAGLVLLGGYWAIYTYNIPGFMATGYLP